MPYMALRLWFIWSLRLWTPRLRQAAGAATAHPWPDLGSQAWDLGRDLKKLP